MCVCMYKHIDTYRQPLIPVRNNPIFVEPVNNINLLPIYTGGNLIL